MKIATYFMRIHTGSMLKTGIPNSDILYSHHYGHGVWNRRNLSWFSDMASSPTELYLPQTFPYPIKIVSIDARAPVSIQRGTRLLGYSFVHLPPSSDAQPETRFGTWDAAIEGTVDKWNIKIGDVLSLRKAKERPVVVVTEPCKHGMQLGGLCVLCGKDMTKYLSPLAHHETNSLFAQHRLHRLLRCVPRIYPNDSFCLWTNSVARRSATN